MKVKRLVSGGARSLMRRSDASGDDTAVDNQLDLATFWQQWLNWQAPLINARGHFMMRWRRVLPR